MTKALPLDEAREIAQAAHILVAQINDGGFLTHNSGDDGYVIRIDFRDLRKQAQDAHAAIVALGVLINGHRRPGWLDEFLARQEIAALSDGDRTCAEDAQAGGGQRYDDETPRDRWSWDESLTRWKADALRLRKALRSRDATIADLEKRLAESRQSGVDWERAGAVWRKRVEEQVDRASLAERERDEARATIADQARRIRKARRMAEELIIEPGTNVDWLRNDRDRVVALLSQDKEASS